MVEYIYTSWKEDRSMEALGFTWPAEKLTDEKGNVVDGIISTILPTMGKEREELLRQFVIDTKAYGLFVIEPFEAQIRAIFETHHGSRCWNIPIERHGDVRVLGRPTIHDNTQSVGLLWKQKTGSA
jgi:hypothetical protein